MTSDRRLLLRVVAAGGALSLLAGCSVPVSSDAFIRSRPAPAIDTGAFRQALPNGFRVADDCILFAQGQL
jgi:hypothetical protein